MSAVAPSVGQCSSIAGMLLAAAIQLTAACAGSEQGFPYVAYVAQGGVDVRSGPGAEHYPTGELPVGFAVEVYRHDGEGWCAIRPPDGSFSLAPARQLRLTDSRTAEVLGDEVVVRVGAAEQQPADAVQVLLGRGETVQLVEPPQPQSPWIKISPPAGEFRWIAARQLSRTPPVEGATSADSESTWQPEARQADDASDALATSADDFEHLLQSAPGGEEAIAPGGADSHWNSHPSGSVAHGAAAGGLQQEIKLVPGSPAAIMLAQHQEPAASAASDAPAGAGQPRIRFRGLSAHGTLDPRVAEMHVKLSSIVAQPPGGWQLQPLREEAAALLAAEQSSSVRRQLRDLVDRVVTFEKIQERRLTAGVMAGAATPGPVRQGSTAEPGAQPADAATPNSELLARVRSDLGAAPDITPTPGGGGGAPPATEALYDAVGTLKPVVSRRSQAPRYALVDDHGDVVTFVTASTDVNLQAYVGKRIGVSGARGFMPEYRRAHVTASRITPLEERLVR